MRLFIIHKLQFPYWDLYDIIVAVRISLEDAQWTGGIFDIKNKLWALKYHGELLGRNVTGLCVHILDGHD